MLTRIVNIALVATVVSFTADGAERTIAAGSKVFVAPMNGFETYIKAAITKKKVPIVIVENRETADFELSGAAESQKAGAAKKIIMLDWRSTEQASIKMTDMKSSEVVFAYSVNKASSAHGKQSSAEACAKHLKEAIKPPAKQNRK